MARGLTHFWAHDDRRTLCGLPVTGPEFSPEPTCPECKEKLAQENAYIADLIDAAKAKAEGPEHTRDEQVVKAIIVLLHDNGFKEAAEFVGRVVTARDVLRQLR